MNNYKTMRLYKTNVALTREQMTTLKKLGAFHKVLVSKIFMRDNVSSSRIAAIKINDEQVFVYNLTDAQEKQLRLLIAKAVSYSILGEEEASEHLMQSIDLDNLSNILECEEIQDQIASVKRVILRMW